MTTREPVAGAALMPQASPGGPRRLLRIQGLDKYFGQLHVLRELDLDLAENERLVVIGPSGGGKSTLLRCVMGLEEIDRGQIAFDDQVYIEAPAGRTGAGPSSTSASSSRSAWCSSTIPCSRICR